MTDVTVLSQLPKRVDLHLYEGATFTMIVTLTESGSPMDISGESFVAAMDDGALFDVTITDGPGGVLKASIQEPKRFARSWDLWMTSRNQCVLTGKVCVEEGVSP